MIYIIGGNIRLAEDYCKRMLGISPHDTTRVRVFSVMTLTRGPGLRGYQFHPGDKVYQVGMAFATSKELLEIKRELDVCTAGLSVKVEQRVYPQSGANAVLVMTMLGHLDPEIDPEMREIEELRRKLTELHQQ